jgi:hypothetical protein
VHVPWRALRCHFLSLIEIARQLTASPELSIMVIVQPAELQRIRVRMCTFDAQVRKRIHDKTVFGNFIGTNTRKICSKSDQHTFEAILKNEQRLAAE